MSDTHFCVANPAEFNPVIVVCLNRAQAVAAGAAVITLTGDLGAGKTTFTQQLAQHLGVTEPVVSPTFGIMKSYMLFDHEYFDQLVHIDAYRIEEISEAGPLRFAELFQAPRTLVCLEWPAIIADLLPVEHVAVTLSIAAGEERSVTVA